MQFYKPRIDRGGAFFEVPIIAVFTKFDQFKRNIRMDLGASRETDINADVEAAFDQHYLDKFTKRPSFVRLESEDFLIT